MISLCLQRAIAGNSRFKSPNASYFASPHLTSSRFRADTSWYTYAHSGRNENIRVASPNHTISTCANIYMWLINRHFCAFIKYLKNMAILTDISEMDHRSSVYLSVHSSRTSVDLHLFVSASLLLQLRIIVSFANVYLQRQHYYFNLEKEKNKQKVKALAFYRVVHKILITK